MGVENDNQWLLSLLCGIILLVSLFLIYVSYRWHRIRKKVVKPGFYDDLLEHFPLPLFLQEMDMNASGKMISGDVVVWNEAARLLYGVEQPMRLFDILKAETFLFLMENCKKAFLKKARIKLHQVIHLRSGVAIDALLTLRIITFRGKRYVMGVTIDLQGMAKIIEATVFSSLEREEFMRKLSYKVRIPMNDIIGFTELLTLEQDEEKRKEYADIVFKKSLELSDLVCKVAERDMLYKIEGGHV